MKRKELEKWYTICIIISSFVLIENIWYALTFAPDIRKEILYGIMLIMNLSYFFFMKYKKVALAYSGGIDSSYLLYMAKK